MKNPWEGADVLVVDDDLTFHDHVGAMARRLGLGCTFVRFGEDALKLLSQRTFRLLVLDGLLPGMRGEEVARRVRKIHGKDELPILFCSAFYRDFRSFRLLMNECGVDLILHKPVTDSQLTEAIGRLLGIDGSQALGVEPVELAALRASYLSASLERMAGMKQALHSLGGDDTASLLAALRIDAHRFRGSGASFEVPEVSRIGGAMEDLLVAAGTPAGPSVGVLRARLEGLVGALEGAFRAAAGSAPLLQPRLPGMRPRVVLVEDGESELSRQIPSHEAQGLPIWHGRGDEALLVAVQRQAEVVFVAADVDGRERALEACRSVRTLANTGIVFLAKDDSTAMRLAALEAGATGYVARPADVEGLFRIASIYARIPSIGPLVVAGGESGILADLAEKLADLGRPAVPCADPSELLRILEESEPSALILDVDAPWEDGLALIRMVRADLRFRALPILALSEHQDRDWTSEALVSGATACLSKPISLLELEPVLSSWAVRRDDRERGLLGLDAQTGLMDRGRFEAALQRSLNLARREGQVFSVVGIDGGLERVRRRDGSLVVEELSAVLANQLRTALRSSDVVARVGRDRFVALLPGARLHDAERIAGERAKEFNAFLGRHADLAGPQTTVLSFPEQGGTAGQFLETIDRVLDEKLRKDAWEEDLIVDVEP